MVVGEDHICWNTCLEPTRVDRLGIRPCEGVVVAKKTSRPNASAAKTVVMAMIAARMKD
jgi:hypothetical protein